MQNSWKPAGSVVSIETRNQDEGPSFTGNRKGGEVGQLESAGKTSVPLSEHTGSELGGKNGD